MINSSWLHNNTYAYVYVCVLMRVCLRVQKCTVVCAVVYVRVCVFRSSVCLGVELREYVLCVCDGYLVVIQMRWC